MKKAVLLALLTCVVLAHYVNCLIPLLPLSVTSKVTILILSSFVFSSVALLVTLVLLGIWPTTRKPGGLNPLRVLVTKEKEILAGLKKTEMASKESIQLTNGTDILFPLINPLKENHHV